MRHLGFKRNVKMTGAIGMQQQAAPFVEILRKGTQRSYYAVIIVANEK